MPGLGYLTIKRVTQLDNSVTYINLITGSKELLNNYQEMTTNDNILTHKSFNKFFFGIGALNKAKLRKRLDIIKKEILEIRYSVPWLYNDKYYYVVLYRNKKGLYVLDELYELVFVFLDGFLQG